ALRARTYQTILAAHPNLLGEINARTRYNAACSAVLAAARSTDASDASHLRQQANSWLRAELSMWQSDSTSPRADVAAVMNHWQQEQDLASVRRTEAIDALPESEQQQWRELWRDVAALRAALRKR